MADEKKTNIDQTRDRLEIDNLDNDARKQLFNQFVKKGGEVISPSSSKSSASTTTRVEPVNRQPRATSAPRAIPRSSTSTNSYSSTASRNSTATNNRDTISNISERKKLPLIKRISVWIKAYSAGVINFNGKTINENFLLFIYKQIAPQLTEIDSLIFSILYPIDEDKEVADKKHTLVINAFKDLNDYELLERVRKFNDKEAYSNIIKNSSMNIDTAYEYLNDFKAIFKPLFLIRLYITRLNQALSNGFIAHNNVEKLRKELIDARIASFNKVIDIIYNKYYNKLQLLISYISQKELVSNVELNEFLNISDEDILGFYVLQIKKDINKKITDNKNSKEDKTTLSPEEKKSNLIESKVITIGMKMIENFVSFEKSTDEKDAFYNISEHDKIYKLKVLFDFLEREYGYVLISNKVKYAVIYEKQKKTDYQRIFNNSFASLADLPIKLNEYVNMVVDMQSVEKDEKINFMQKSIIVSEKKSRVSYISRNIQSSFISIITPIKEALDKLLLEKDERNRIIENQNDIIQIDESYLKSKPRIKGYSVIKAITEAYYFISALKHITTSNDLTISAMTGENKPTNRVKNSRPSDEIDEFRADIEMAKKSISNLDVEEMYDTDMPNEEDNVIINTDDINTETEIDDILEDTK